MRARSSCNEETGWESQTGGGIAACGTERYTTVGTLLATLCRFDHKPKGTLKTGPFIPWQRRLAIMEILRIQGRGFMTGF